MNAPPLPLPRQRIKGQGIGARCRLNTQPWKSAGGKGALRHRQDTKEATLATTQCRAGRATRSRSPVLCAGGGRGPPQSNAVVLPLIRREDCMGFHDTEARSRLTHSRHATTQTRSLLLRRRAMHHHALALHQDL